MPIFVQFLFEKKVMDHESLRKWLRQGRCTYPPPLIENNILDKYLLRVTKTYGFLQQPEFIHDLAEFSTQLDLGLNQRESLRLARFILSFAGGRVDYTGNPEDDFYLHPIDLPLLNREGRGMIMEHLSAGEMFDICDVLIVSETHTCHSASKYLHISHAYLAGEQKYEIRVMLDGLGRRANNHKLDKWTINRNYPFIDNTLYQNYQFYGLEPEESQMFTSCEKIHSLDKTQKHKIASWLYFNVREDEEFKKAVKSMGLHIYNKLMDDANEFASKKELTFEMEQVIRQVGKNIEFQNQSAIRMDVNFAWGHTIEEVLNKRVCKIFCVNDILY